MLRLKNPSQSSKIILMRFSSTLPNNSSTKIINKNATLGPNTNTNLSKYHQRAKIITFSSNNFLFSTERKMNLLWTRSNHNSKFRLLSSFKSYIKCKSWTKWPRCNSFDSKQICSFLKIYQLSNNLNSFSNSAIIKLRYKCRTRNIRWCSVKAFTVAIWINFRIRGEQITKDLLHNMLIFQAIRDHNKEEVQFISIFWSLLQQS